MWCLIKTDISPDGELCCRITISSITHRYSLRLRDGRRNPLQEIDDVGGILPFVPDGIDHLDDANTLLSVRTGARSWHRVGSTGVDRGRILVELNPPGAVVLTAHTCRLWPRARVLVAAKSGRNPDWKIPSSELVILPAIPISRYSRSGSAISSRKYSRQYQDCGYEADADHNTAKNIATRYCGYIHRGQTSRGGWASSQLALNSGTLNVNGDYTPAELLG